MRQASAQAASQLVESFSSTPDECGEIARAILEKQHPTNQQTAIRLALCILYEAAKIEDTDIRNEAGVGLAKEIKKAGLIRAIPRL